MGFRVYQSLGGTRGAVNPGEHLPEHQEHFRREPHELDPALVEQDGLLARARCCPAHGRVDDPGLQEELPLGIGSQWWVLQQG